MVTWPVTSWGTETTWFGVVPDTMFVSAATPVVVVILFLGWPEGLVRSEQGERPLTYLKWQPQEACGESMR
jgi:hypothetical protein